jgi:dienelactone hydrolase
VKSRIEWLLGEGPAYRTAEVKIGQGETEEEAKVLRRGPVQGKLRFENVNANLYFSKPKQPGAKMPGIVFLAPFHTPTGYIPDYRSGDPFHARLAESGFVVLAFDPIGTGGRQLERRDFYVKNPDWSLMGKMVVDARHAIDALRAVAEVDQKQIYLVGFGMGGMAATLTAAVDDRVAGAVGIAGWTPLRTDTDDKPTGGVRRWSHLYGLLPRLGAYVAHEADIPVDFEEILSATAPRAVFIMQPQLDWHANPSEVATAVENARRAYRERQAEERIKLSMPEDWCRLTNAMEGEVIEWLKARSKQ